MNKFFRLVSFLIILIASQNADGQIARLLDYKDVMQMKKSNTYFILFEDQNEKNTAIKEAFEMYWSFNQIKFDYFKNISSLKNDKDAFIISISDGSITMGKSSPGEFPMKPGVSASFSALFISSRIREYTFNSPGKWEGGILTRNPGDIIQFLPLYVKMLNSMLIQIEENKTSKFKAETAEKIYNSNTKRIENRTVYVLKEQLPFSKKGIKLHNINAIKKLYEGDIKIVTRKELEDAISNGEDVIFLHFYNELKFNMYTAISCKSGDVIALGSKKNPQYYKFIEWSLKDLNQR